MIQRQSFAPPAHLAAFVDRFWTWRSGPADALPTIFPGTGAEVIFHIEQPPCVTTKSGSIQELATAHLLCLRSYSSCLRSDHPVSFVAVRLRTGVLESIVRHQPAELHDAFVPAEDAFGKIASEASERLREKVTTKERLSILKEFCEEAVIGYRLVDKRLRFAASHLYYHSRDARIDALAEQLSVSQRHLQRTFEGAFGMSPKKYQRIARLHQTLRELLLGQDQDYLATALAHGYCDQSHFIHELGALTGLVPSQVLNAEHFTSHFYNPRCGRWG